jgi:hypothetical protein
VLLQDLRIAPARWPIELGDDHAAAFQEDLEDPVLVRVELDQATVSAQAHAIERVEHDPGRQAGIRRGGAVGCVLLQPASLAHRAWPDSMELVMRRPR